MGRKPLFSHGLVIKGTTHAQRPGSGIYFIVIVILGGASTILTACSTVEGAGKDISKAGHEVSEEATEHK